MADALEFELETPLPIDTIIKGDCIEEMKKLPSNSFDVAIIDPPYNLSSGGNWSWDNSEKLAGFGGNWSKVMENWDNMPLIEYFNFCSAWIGEVKRLVKPTGSFWIHGTYHNIGIINFILQLQNIEIINIILDTLQEMRLYGTSGTVFRISLVAGLPQVTKQFCGDIQEQQKRENIILTMKNQNHFLSRKII